MSSSKLETTNLDIITTALGALLTAEEFQAIEIVEQKKGIYKPINLICMVKIKPANRKSSRNPFIHFQQNDNETVNGHGMSFEAQLFDLCSQTGEKNPVSKVFRGGSLEILHPIMPSFRNCFQFSSDQ